jgi:hypothetical protein
MTPLFAVLFASIAGALLFFLAGYFLGRRPARSPVEALLSGPAETEWPAPALQALVARVVRDDVRAAVITDRQGFQVAGRGEHGDALAAFGAFLLDAGARARDGLPLSGVQTVCVRDLFQATVTVQPLFAAGPDLALVTLCSAQKLRDGNNEVGP